MFSREFGEISQNTLFTEHLWATAFSKIQKEKVIESKAKRRNEKERERQREKESDTQYERA